MKHERPEDVFYRYGYYGLRNVLIMAIIIMVAALFIGLVAGTR